MQGHYINISTLSSIQPNKKLGYPIYLLSIKPNKKNGYPYPCGWGYPQPIHRFPRTKRLLSLLLHVRSYFINEKPKFKTKTKISVPTKKIVNEQEWGKYLNYM
jgi:hypothetical protein